MTIDKSYVQEALLRWNYFPNQKKNSEEIPPIFTTKNLVPDVAAELNGIELRKGGYDQVEYQSTRYNNVSRTLSLPHPLPYVKLVMEICESWDKIEYISNNKTSCIKPSVHSDNRLIIMDYGEDYTSADYALSHSFGKKFQVKTDISNCYPSIYTHAIPWALIGFREAKAKSKREFRKEWFNKVDEYQRMLKRNETQGIAIGPATSNIITEIILAKIDSEMSKKYSYHRYIDDYTGYCETYEEAENFIRALRENLRKYKLTLNIKKTKIVPLPTPIDSDWIVELATRIPSGSAISELEAIRYIDFSLNLSKEKPDGSVLKFAIKSIIPRLSEQAKRPVFEYLLYLVGFYPILLPLVLVLAESETIETNNYEQQLNSIIKENALAGRSDGIAWGIYYLYKYNLKVNSKVANTIIKSKDCISILLLYLTGDYKSEIHGFCETIDQYGYELDQYWVLLYQLFLDGVIENPYNGIDGNDDKVFAILKKFDVSFIERENYKTSAESKFEQEKLKEIFTSSI